MAALVLLLVPLAVVAVGGVIVSALRQADQTTRDKHRKAYKLFFPSVMTPEDIAKFLDGISGHMHRKTGNFILPEPTPSLAFEVWATAGRIEHWLRVPWQYEESILPTLLTLVPGTRVSSNDRYPDFEPTYAVEQRIKHSHRPLHIPDGAALSSNVLKSFSYMDHGETLMMQWAVTPAAQETMPIHGHAKTKEPRFGHFASGNFMANKDEVNDRRTKLKERNYAAVLRVAARASSDARSIHLVEKVTGVIKSTDGPVNHLVRRKLVRHIQQRIAIAASPELAHPQIVVTVSELAALLGWRTSGVHVPGMPPTLSMSLPTPENVPRDGRKIGTSNFFGRDRDVALAYPEALKHMYFSGGTGSGKTTLMENCAAQDMRNGNGVIVIENKGDLFHHVLDLVPRNRLNDVVILDVNDQSWPVGFNVLQQGNPAVAVDELNIIFNNLFQDRPSMWMQEVLYHALHTLAQDKTGTFMDVYPLLIPKSDEVAWAANLKDSVHDPEIRDFWQRFDKDPKRDQKIEPLMSRLWPIMRSNLINIFGQAESGFSMADVIKNNKILLINLAGLEDMSAKLAGTILTNAVWQAVKSNPVKTPNFLYIDEFQSFLKLPVDPQDMLAKARSFGLGLVLANQHLAQLDDDMRDAIMSNAHTKVIFQVGDPTDARRLAASFGSMVTAEDFVNLGRYEALARVATETGNSAPFTMTTLAPTDPTGLNQQVRYASRANYGKRVDEVRAAMTTKRRAYDQAKPRKRIPSSNSPI